MNDRYIKENIRRIRKGRGLTQEELASQLGISLTAYRDLEKGSTSIVNSHISKIASITGTTEEEIILGYRPAQSEGQLNDIHTEYGNKVELLRARITELEKMISLLEETLDSKNEIISMLKKNIDDNK